MTVLSSRPVAIPTRELESKDDSDSGITNSKFWWSRNRSRNHGDWNRNHGDRNRNRHPIPHIYEVL